MDMARWLLKSEPVSLYATVAWKDLPQFGSLAYNVMNVIKFENDVTWINEFSSDVGPATGPPMRLEIVGDGGNTVVADGPEKVILQAEKEEERREWPLNLTRSERWGHKPQDEYFVRSVVQGNEEPIVKMQDAKKAMKMSLAILESSRTSGPVYFNDV